MRPAFLGGGTSQDHAAGLPQESVNPPKNPLGPYTKVPTVDGILRQVMEGYAAVKGQSVPLNGSSCAQVKAWRIVALDGERASASGGASQNLRLRTK